MSSSSSNLWLDNATHRVFGWKQLLEEWDSTSRVPPQVKRVLDNLQAASDLDGPHDPRLAQFLTYLNYEQEGIAWFLYECIAVRYLHGTIRLDYVRSLVDEIENLDAYFPRFLSGGPYYKGLTIRQFVEENLKPDELEAVQMMPPLTRLPYQQTPTRPVTCDVNCVQRAPNRLRRTSCIRPVDSAPEVRRTLSQQFESLLSEPKKKTMKQCIQVRFLRTKDGSKDDILTVTQNSADSYNMLYLDQQAGIKTKTVEMSRAAVVDFLSMTLRLITVDEDPFESVQFTLPSMPAIIVTPRNLTSQTRELIYESVTATMNNWPVTV